jgi:hypothetical protein
VAFAAGDASRQRKPRLNVRTGAAIAGSLATSLTDDNGNGHRANDTKHNCAGRRKSTNGNR